MPHTATRWQCRMTCGGVGEMDDPQFDMDKIVVEHSAAAGILWGIIISVILWVVIIGGIMLLIRSCGGG